MSDINLSNLLDIDRDAGVFRVARRSFTEQQLFEAERAQIFDRCWLYLGHSSELKKKGAFVTRSVGGRNLIFNRDAAGTVHAFLNSCPHRGATVCREAAGNAKNFTCSYHGWVFGADGKMRDLPGIESYSDNFNGSGCADLVAVPRLEQYRDFWFACFDAAAVSLVEYLAGATEYLDLVADQSEAGMEIISGTQEYAIRANWKLLVENSFDGYHAISTHATYFDYLKNMNGVLSQGNVIGFARDLGNGHAVVEYSAPWGRPVANWVPAWGEERKGEIDALYDRLVAKHGEERATRIAKNSRNLLIFPNLMIVDVMSLTLRTFYPKSPDYNEVTAWSIGPSEESGWLRKNRLHSFLEFLGPGGFATPDDVEMLEQCQRGYSNAREAGWNDISRGMKKAEPATVDEHQIRVFWERWNSLVQQAQPK
ncbi:MAG: aromatic ring-hydroxylating oxygenase subunit alpha [Burkholderiaceae bacterium]